VGLSALSEGSGCGKCKRVHERVASILPFSVSEKITDKPLRISGLAMTAGLSRNFNLYTSEELSGFAGKLQAAPVYLEHVSVNDSVGKVTKTEWDGQNLLYEAEIYDEETAAKIRKGLIRHVSVGADYETLDVTAGGKVPHGLHNAEMSLVAVPGIPETNIQVLEALWHQKGVGGLEEKDIEKVAEKVAAKIGEKNSLEIEGLKTKLLEAEGKLVATEGKLAEANRTVEQLKQLVPGVDLLKNPPKLMPVSEAVKMVKEVLPAPMIQRSWRLGPQRLCQDLQRVVQKLETRAGGK
jgi:hypothetical protein